VSEWLLFQTLFLSFQLPALFLKLMIPIAAAVLALTGVFALVCFAKAFGISFLALPRSSHAEHAEEVPIAMRIGMGILAVGCVGLGLGPMIVVPLLDRITGPLTGVSISDKALALDGWAFVTVDVQFGSVSPPMLAALLIAGGLLGLFLAFVVGGRLVKRYYKTWGCGINLSPRMEYTATGFTQPLNRIFSTIYQPTVKLETEFLEESRYVAKRRRFEIQIKPVFEKYLYDPVINAFVGIADWLRVLQAGSLRLYLAYILVTLVVLLLFAV
jgi:hydrogenase-4 component B